MLVYLGQERQRRQACKAKPLRLREKTKQKLIMETSRQRDMVWKHYF